MTNIGVGVVGSSGGKDYLYRVSLRALIRNDAGDILVIKEKGRDFWELPGGGLEYGESIRDGLARELEEELGLAGDFEYRILAAQEPSWNTRIGAMQINLIFEVIPEFMHFGVGADGAVVSFQAKEFVYKNNAPESKICLQLDSLSNYL